MGVSLATVSVTLCLTKVVTNAISISDLKKSYGSKWESLKRRGLALAAFGASYIAGCFLRYFEESFTAGSLLA